MDSWVKQKLKEWGFERYERVFEEEEVDRIAFACLRDDSIKAMIPKVGPQTKFLSQWNAEFGNSSSVDSVRSVQCANKPMALMLDESSVSFPFPEGLPVMNKSHSATAEIEVVTHQAVDSPGPSSTACVNRFWRIDSADLTLQPCNLITDLIETLKDSVEGIAILHYYKEHRDLEDEHRNLLVDIIISVEMRSSPSLSVSPDRLQELAHLIVQTFPTEILEVYYIPYQKSAFDQRTVCAKGKLSNRLGHRRSFLIHCGASERLKSKKRKFREQPAALRLAFRTDFQSDECCAADYEKKIEWLKTSIDPWSTVEKYWSDTSKRRIRELNDIKSRSSETYMTDFPCLTHPINGTALIEIDFAQIHPEKTEVLFTNYSSFENEILTFCKTKKKRLDSGIKNLIQIIDEENENTTNGQHLPDLKSAATFLLLPLLLPPPAARKASNISHRPNKEEVQSEFLLHVKSIAALELELSSRRQRILTRGESEQPLAVIIGKTLHSIEECYVCINDVRYLVPSVLKAIDITFKSFYALQLDYPKSAVLPWMVIQRRFYEIQGETDVVIPSISKFVAELEQISNQKSA